MIDNMIVESCARLNTYAKNHFYARNQANHARFSGYHARNQFLVKFLNI